MWPRELFNRHHVPLQCLQLRFVIITIYRIHTLLFHLCLALLLDAVLVSTSRTLLIQTTHTHYALLQRKEATVLQRGGVHAVTTTSSLHTPAKSARPTSWCARDVLTVFMVKNKQTNKQKNTLTSTTTATTSLTTAVIAPDLHGHRVVLADPKKIYPKFRGNWHCDICGEGGKRKSQMFHCFECGNVDICTKCLYADIET